MKLTYDAVKCLENRDQLQAELADQRSNLDVGTPLTAASGDGGHSMAKRDSPQQK